MPESIALRRSFTALHRVETATHHPDILKDSGTKQFLYMDILNTMLAVARVEIWEEAVMASTRFDEPFFTCLIVLLIQGSR